MDSENNQTPTGRRPRNNINYKLFNQSGTKRQATTGMAEGVVNADVVNSPFPGSGPKNSGGTPGRGRGRQLATKKAAGDSVNLGRVRSEDCQAGGLGRLKSVVQTVPEEDVLELDYQDTEFAEDELTYSEEKGSVSESHGSRNEDSEEEIDRELEEWKEKVQEARNFKQAREDQRRKDAKKEEIRKLRREHENLMKGAQEPQGYRREERFGPDELRSFRRLQEKDEQQRRGASRYRNRPETTESFFQEFGRSYSREEEVPSEVGDWDEEEYDREGEGTSRSQYVKSGMFCKPTDKVEVRESWPHMNLVDGYPGKKKSITFHDLEFDLFVAGELERITSWGISQVEKEGRLYLLKLLAYIHANSGWETVQSIYAAILQKIEKRILAWDQARTHFQSNVQWMVTQQCLEAKGKPRKGAANTGKNKSGYKKPAGVFASQDLWWCRAYNRGTCSEVSPHQGTVNNRSVQVQHFCPRCYLRDREIRAHREGSEDCQHREQQ